MNFFTFIILVCLQTTISLCAPTNSRGIAGRTAQTGFSTHGLVERQFSTVGGGGFSGISKPNADDVQQAADNFAGDVATVSNSLNTLGITTDTAQRKKLAKAGFDAETDEDAQRAVLFAAGNNVVANQKIVVNTPIVLDGLQSIMENPSDANTAKQLQTMETARNANILPSITALTNSAFQATGVNAAAKNFQPTTGTQAITALLAFGGGQNGGNAQATKGGKRNNGNGKRNRQDDDTAQNTKGGKNSNAQATNGRNNANDQAGADNQTTQPGKNAGSQKTRNDEDN
ncbi:uncharacterized protein BCR38DRAFT_487120 [Pseudomassariella vexata]|uniref:Ppe family protein n=1 Tax=Pseudomassariella vexata TaxID=1141098 RepID=A0A1Y2DQ05_9PEZI|nr:uncharacterized protein BCR38DRAFT_487120 [Pseudomassariella vexata]ORY61368.1 hypothetical protein BCR38DRAFT_487120 [Pseudomassariella vexata]